MESFLHTVADNEKIVTSYQGSQIDKNEFSAGRKTEMKPNHMSKGQRSSIMRKSRASQINNGTYGGNSIRRRCVSSYGQRNTPALTNYVSVNQIPVRAVESTHA